MVRKRRSQDGEVAKEKITLYLTSGEKEQVQSRAGTLPVGRYCRNIILGKRQSLQRIPEVNRLTYLELGRIGNNLNQLARAVHQARLEGISFAIDPQNLEDLRETIRNIQLQVMSINFEDTGEP